MCVCVCPFKKIIIIKINKIKQKVARLDMCGCNLLVWDLGGKSDLRSIWEHYFQEAHAIVYVLDSSDVERMGENKKTLGKKKFFLFKGFLLSSSLFC